MEQEEIEYLRKRLMDYYWAATPLYPMAIMDVERIKAASNEEIIQEARKVGFLN